MNKTRKVGPTIGCLMIEDFSSGGQRLSGLCARMNGMGMRYEVFERYDGGELYTSLQNAYYRVRSACDIACILGIGAGLDAAIALSAQLPVDRLALIDGAGEVCAEKPAVMRSVRRIHRYARRNIAFSTADALLVSDGSTASQNRMNRIGQNMRLSSGTSGRIHVLSNNKMCTNGEYLPENQIYRFLSAGELPKSLAENPEMCIIYE